MRSLLAPAFVAALASGTLAGCTGDIGEPETQEPSGGSPTGGDPVAQAITPAPAGIRKLTARQYVNSIRVLLGDAAGDKAAELVAASDPPFDATLNGFDSIGAANFSLTPKHVEQVEAFSREIAQVVREGSAGFSQIVPCSATGPADAACHKQFVESFGRLAWRRPLQQEEVDLLTGVAQFAANFEGVNDFDEGVFYALSAILQSPQFMYIVEIGDEASSDPARRKLSSLELGSRMSFFLLEQTPDKATLDEIEAAGLDSEDKVRALAKKLVGRAEAKSALAGFYSEVYRLRELHAHNKSPDLFPSWSPAVAAAMEQETLKLVDFVVWQQNGDSRDIFDAPYTFINADLAAIYGVTPPASGWAKVTLPESQKRAGFLGHASFATRLSTATRTSPTRRGLFVQQTLLCNEIPPPPPGVVTEIPPDDPMQPKTLKEKLTEHQTNDTCRACHELMDNIGFALETYDPIGKYRTTDAGKTIDTSTTVKDLGEFDSAAGLAAILREDPRGPRCIMKNLFRHSMGHLETEGEDPALEEIEKGFVDGGFKLQDLLVEIVASPAFSLVGEPK